MKAEGKPASPTDDVRIGLVETLLVMLVFAMPATLSSSTPTFAEASRHTGNLIALVPQTALLLYIIGKNGDLGRYFSIRPASADGILGVLAAILAIGLSSAVSLAMMGDAAASIARLGTPDLPPHLFLPLLAASAVAVGAREELLYRVYLIRRLELSGMPTPASAIVSVTLFAAGHAYQGAVGMVSAAMLGALFACLYVARRSWYAIALAHALYDFVAIASSVSWRLS